MNEYPKEKLKLLYNDILLGRSSTIYQDSPINIRHLTNFDVADFDVRYQFHYDEARRQGALTIEEREKILIEEGSWSNEKNKLIKDNQLFLAGMKETKTKLFRQSEIDQINKTIKETETKIKQLEEERLNLLQTTAESFANKKLTEYQISRSLYKDDKQYFNDEEFDALSDLELGGLVKIYNDKLIHFNERNFKRIALCPFFINFFYLSKDNPFTFYGKPIIQLTFFQVEVFAHAVYFKHILSSGNKPPPHIAEDPDLLVDWYNSSKSIKEHLDKGKKPEDIVGLTSKDKERLGIQGGSNIHEKLIQAAKQKGGSLSASDIMNLQGVK